jgi:DNA-binding beta-propeller fold protein YncE
VAVVPGGHLALTANQGSDSVSLVDLEAGKVVAEQSCGRKPVGVACSRDGRRAVVSNLWSGTLTFFELAHANLKLVAQVTVGPFPRGLVFSRDGDSVYAAVAGLDQVLQVDWASRKILRRWPAPHEPRGLALSANGRLLVAASSRSGQVRCWDLHSANLTWERAIEDSFNLRGLAFTPEGQSVVCAHAVRREFPVSRQNIEEGWVIDSRLTRLALNAAAVPFSAQLALDTKGEAVGDPYGLAFSPDGRCLAVTGSGTHELLLLTAAAIPWNSGDPGDAIDPQFRAKRGNLRRVPLGGRPLALAFRGHRDEVVVANYLLDNLQTVDVKSGKLVRSIPLGGPARPSLARKGEALFYDAQRSRHQWFSCNTCHVGGHTCCLNFDTLNDDSYGNPKLTPTLRNVARTGPWTWHGWQEDLGAGVEKSLTQTMFGPRPSALEVKALVAFLETLGHPPNPNVGPHGDLSDAARRGQELFHGQARCGRCHQGDNYTSEHNYDVKLEPDGSPYHLWNPPSLRGLYDRGPYLHDGRAGTLEELLRLHHSAEKLGGQPLTAAERQDLIAFLRSI